MAKTDESPTQLGLYHAAVDAATTKGMCMNSITSGSHLLTELPCPKCGVIAKLQIAPGNGPHAYRANCAHCGTFIHWLSKYTLPSRSEGCADYFTILRKMSSTKLSYVLVTERLSASISFLHGLMPRT